MESRNTIRSKINNENERFINGTESNRHRNCIQST